MDLNMENNIDTIILHIGVDDIFQERTLDKVTNYIKNVELMVQSVVLLEQNGCFFLALCTLESP